MNGQPLLLFMKRIQGITVVNNSLVMGNGEIGIQKYEYNPRGSLCLIQNRGMNWNMQQTSDALGRPIDQTDPSGLVTQIQWGPAGRLKSVQPSSEKGISLVWDDDNLGVVMNRGVQSTHLRYNGFGDLICETRNNPGGTQSHRSYGYDASGRKTWESLWLRGPGADTFWTQATPEGGMGWVYTYDEFGRVTRSVDPNGSITDTAYSVDGNPRVNIQKVYPSPTKELVTTFTHDLLGRLVGVKDPKNQTTTYAFNARGQRTRVDRSGSML